MQTHPLHPIRAVSSRPSPVEIWQKLLTCLLARHYGLALNDTPFSDVQVIQEHIDAGISLCDAVNFIVEKHELSRIDRPQLSFTDCSPLINSIDNQLYPDLTSSITHMIPAFALAFFFI